LVRKVVRKQITKKWEMLKTCKDIIDENEEIVAGMSMKERLKENIILNGKEAKEYDNWKVRNLKTLNLKESKIKETVKSGPFERKD
jgi:hypothetical protein